MDYPRGPLLNLAYFCQGKGTDDLRHTLLLTTMELEETKMKAQEEIRIRDDEIIQLKDLLEKTMREKEEANAKFQKLVFEKFLLQQQLQLQQQIQQLAPISGISSIEDEPRRGMDSNSTLSSSDCEGSIVSSPPLDSLPQAQIPKKPTLETEQSLPILIDKPLPEKGKFLQAVMKAGPLLQTLLLAGPLPQWRHPPPPIDTYEIPPPPIIPSPPPQPPTPTLPIPSLHQDPLLNMTNCYSVSNCGRGLSRKRGLFESSDSCSEAKYQRILLQ